MKPSDLVSQMLDEKIDARRHERPNEFPSVEEMFKAFKKINSDLASEGEFDTVHDLSDAEYYATQIEWIWGDDSADEPSMAAIEAAEALKEYAREVGYVLPKQRGDPR